MTMLGPLASSPSLIRVYTCKKCRKVYLVAENDTQINLLAKSMRCPNSEFCNSRIKIYASTNMKVVSSMRVTALHLYQACMGAGLPFEKRCGPKEVRKMLLGATILEAQLEPSPDPKRSLIMSLTLSCGKILHFAASTRGATIYKVTELTNGS